MSAPWFMTQTWSVTVSDNDAVAERIAAYISGFIRLNPYGMLRIPGRVGGAKDYSEESGHGCAMAGERLLRNSYHWDSPVSGSYIS